MTLIPDLLKGLEQKKAAAKPFCMSPEVITLSSLSSLCGWGLEEMETGLVPFSHHEVSEATFLQTH